MFHTGAVELPLPPDMACFYAPNTTRVIEALLQWALYRDHLSLNLVGDFPPHPVLRDLLGNDDAGARTVCEESVGFMTYMDWLTGNIADVPPETDSVRFGCRYVILDAAQAFGCLTSVETDRIFDLARKGFVICGCLQKWIGSQVPLGFAFFDVSMLRTSPGLSEFLAARDYLGTGISPREGFHVFPDTFSSFVAHLSKDALSFLLGRTESRLDDLARVIAANREWIVEQFRLTRVFEVLDGEKARGIVAVTSASPRIDRLSSRLHDAGFRHSKFLLGTHHLPSPVLRLSAPTVEMSAACKQAFSTILHNESA